MTDAEDRHWAGKLIPNSGFSTSVHVLPDHEPVVLDPCTGFYRLFAGLRYAAFTAPGPTGTRAEHVTHLLNVPRRTHANNVHRALTNVFLCISRGALPPSARWLTRALLCGQRRKTALPDPSKWASSCDQLTPSDRSARCKTAFDPLP